MKDLIADILASIERYPNNHAFVIDGKAHTYEELGQRAAGVYALIAASEEPAIGIVAGNDIDTYAAILGVLFSGKTYVILHPSFPQDRNLRIAAQADLRTIIVPTNKGGGVQLSRAERHETDQPYGPHRLDLRHCLQRTRTKQRLHHLHLGKHGRAQGRAHFAG